MHSNAYYLLCGLGVGTLNLWRFVEAQASSGNEPSWNFLYSFAANGNTAMVAEFITSPTSTDGSGSEEDADASSSSLTIAATCNDRNLRVWELEHTSTELQSDGNDTGDDEESEDPFQGHVHTIKSHHDIPNTKDILAIYGEYAYIIEPTGEMYRILIREPGVRHQFELEKLDGGGGNTSKSRRSMILLESVYASDNGKVLIAVSTEGVFYYSNSVGGDPESGASFLRIIGRNASLNPQYKTPMKVYTPRVLTSQSSKNANAKPLEPMMAVVTNPQSEDEGGDGYFNVDPTEGFASRWMVPSRGRDCWVCGVRNVSHWQPPTEQQQQKTAQKQHETNEHKQQRHQHRQQKPNSSSGEKRQSIDVPSPRGRIGSESTPQSTKAKAKAAKSTIVASSSLSSASSSGNTVTKPGASLFAQSGTAASSPSVSHGKPPSGSSSKKARQRNDTDEDEAGSGGQSRSSSGGSGASSSDIVEELERYKERYNKIVMEWQRRLKGERQMRRLWKTRETEFNSELDDALEKLYAAEQELLALKTQHKDAEKRYIFEKLKAEQQSSVKARYEQLCEQMTEKLALVDDQKRVMEQTTRTLLQEVDRNVRSLKTSAALLERNECIVCKDKEANTAIIPCGHLVFCEEDGEVYRRNSGTANSIVCPVCQRELISLLRIY